MKRAIWTGGALALVMAMTAAGADADQRGEHRRDGGMRGHHGGMMMLDANGDGEVSRDEFEDPRGARFAAADANGDGELTAEEMIAYQEGRRAMRREARATRMIERFDADGNGTISLEEMQAGGRDRAGRFDALDTDGDGILSEDELAAARDARGERRGDR